MSIETARNALMMMGPDALEMPDIPATLRESHGIDAHTAITLTLAERARRRAMPRGARRIAR